MRKGTPCIKAGNAAEAAVRGWGRTSGWGQPEDIKGWQHLGSPVAPTWFVGRWMPLTTMGKTVDSSRAAEGVQTT